MASASGLLTENKTETTPPHAPGHGLTPCSAWALRIPRPRRRPWTRFQGPAMAPSYPTPPSVGPGSANTATGSFRRGMAATFELRFTCWKRAGLRLHPGIGLYPQSPMRRKVRCSAFRVRRGANLMSRRTSQLDVQLDIADRSDTTFSCSISFPQHRDATHHSNTTSAVPIQHISVKPRHPEPATR